MTLSLAMVFDYVVLFRFKHSLYYLYTLAGANHLDDDPCLEIKCADMKDANFCGMS